MLAIKYDIQVILLARSEIIVYDKSRAIEKTAGVPLWPTWPQNIWKMQYTISFMYFKRKI